MELRARHRFQFGSESFGLCLFVLGLCFGTGIGDTKGDLQTQTRTTVGHQFVPNFRPEIGSVFWAPLLCKSTTDSEAWQDLGPNDPLHCPKSSFGGFPNSAQHSSHMCCANMSGDFKFDSGVRFFLGRSCTSKVIGSCLLMGLMSSSVYHVWITH